MQTTIKFAPNLDTSSPIVARDDTHKIKLTVDGTRNYALLECTSREALFELGRTLMEEALFGSGEVEFYPLASDTGELVVNGVRMPEDSARMFVHFPQSGRNVS
jgi:hypothetical protein